MAATVATYCPSRMVKHSKSKSTQPRFATRWVTLYNSSLDVLEAVEAGALLEHARRVLHEGGLHGGGRGGEFKVGSKQTLFLYTKGQSAQS